MRRMLRVHTHTGPVVIIAATGIAVALLSLARAGLLPNRASVLLRLFPFAASVGAAIVYPLLRWLARGPAPPNGWSRIGEVPQQVLSRGNSLNLIFAGGILFALTGYLVAVGGLLVHAAMPLGILLLAAGMSTTLLCLYLQDALFLWSENVALRHPAVASACPQHTASGWRVSARPTHVFGVPGGGGPEALAKAVRATMGVATGLAFAPVVMLLFAWLSLVELRAGPPEAHLIAAATEILIVSEALVSVAFAPKRAVPKPALGRGWMLRSVCLAGAVLATLSTAVLGRLSGAAAMAGVLVVLLLAEAWTLSSLVARWQLPA